MRYAYFKEEANTYYPTGRYFDRNASYITAVADMLCKEFPSPDSTIYLVVRGTSGCILAGGVSYILKRRHREVCIVVSRKSQQTHGYNMDGIGRYDSEKDILVVLDDFISSGDTIKRIVKDIQDSLSSPYHLNALCVSTPLGEGMHYYNTQEINKIIEMFDVVICNKYIKQGT